MSSNRHHHVGTVPANSSRQDWNRNARHARGHADIESNCYSLARQFATGPPKTIPDATPLWIRARTNSQNKATMAARPQNPPFLNGIKQREHRYRHQNPAAKPVLRNAELRTEANPLPSRWHATRCNTELGTGWAAISSCRYPGQTKVLAWLIAFGRAFAFDPAGAAVGGWAGVCRRATGGEPNGDRRRGQPGRGQKRIKEQRHAGAPSRPSSIISNHNGRNKNAWRRYRRQPVEDLRWMAPDMLEGREGKFGQFIASGDLLPIQYREKRHCNRAPLNWKISRSEPLQTRFLPFADSS